MAAIVAAHMGGEFVEIAGAPGLRAVVAAVEFRIIRIQPHTAAGGDAAEFQLQTGSRQARLSGSQLIKQGAADTAGSNQAHGEHALACGDRRQRHGMWR